MIKNVPDGRRVAVVVQDFVAERRVWCGLRYHSWGVPNILQLGLLGLQGLNNLGKGGPQTQREYSGTIFIQG